MGKRKRTPKITAYIFMSQCDWQMILDALDFYDTEIYEFDIPVPDHGVRSAITSAVSKLKNSPFPDEDNAVSPLTRTEIIAAYYAMQYIQTELDTGDLELDYLPESLHDLTSFDSLKSRLAAHLSELGIVWI